MQYSEEKINKRWERKDRTLKKLHPGMLKALASQVNFDLTVEGSVPENRQCIFIANHFGFHDAPTAAKIIGKHIYVLVSDVDKNTLGGFTFRLNGVIWVHRTDKQDRLRAKEDMLRHLRLSHDLLMYPEATWNMTPNLPMLPMNWGVVKLARETGVPICPMYLFFSDKQCRAKVGELFIPTGDDVGDIASLRDRMATLYWDLLEQQPESRRSDIRPNEQEIEIAERYADYPRARKDPEGVLKYETSLIYRPKGYVSHEEAFEHLEKIKPSKEKAFLFNRQWH